MNFLLWEPGVATRLSDIAPVDPADPDSWPGSLSGPAQALLRYWLSKRGAGGLYPSLADIMPSDILDILPHIFIVDCLGGAPGDYQFRLVGTEIVATEGECTGMVLSELFPDRMKNATIWSQYDDCRKGKVHIRRQNLGWRGKTYINYETLLLPLAGVDGDVVHLIGTAVVVSHPPG